MVIIQETVDQLAAYESVAIGFEVRSRVDLDVLAVSGGQRVEDIPVEPWWKDYDSCEEDRPTMLPARFDFSNWAIFSAFEKEVRLGGTIVARDCPGCDMLEGRADLSVIFDIRIDSGARGRGVGRALFNYVCAWAKQQGCIEVRVETQEVNVGACRFYRAMGCRLRSADLGAYGPDIDEAKLIWSLDL